MALTAFWLLVPGDPAASSTCWRNPSAPICRSSEIGGPEGRLHARATTRSALPAAAGWKFGCPSPGTPIILRLRCAAAHPGLHPHAARQLRHHGDHADPVLSAWPITSPRWRTRKNVPPAVPGAARALSGSTRSCAPSPGSSSCPSRARSTRASSGLGIIDQPIRWLTGFNSASCRPRLRLPAVHAAADLQRHHIARHQPDRGGARIWAPRAGGSTGGSSSRMPSPASRRAASWCSCWRRARSWCRPCSASTQSRWFTEIIQQWIFEVAGLEHGLGLRLHAARPLHGVRACVMMRIFRVKLSDIAK